MDSRRCHANENFELAVEAYCKNDFDNAWQLLGQGLHATQDIHAHGNFGRVNLRQPMTRVHNTYGLQLPGKGAASDYPDDPTLDMGPIRTKWVRTKLGFTASADYAIFYPGTKRIEATEKETKNYMEEFLRRIKKADCYGPLTPLPTNASQLEWDHFNRYQANLWYQTNPPTFYGF